MCKLVYSLHAMSVAPSWPRLEFRFPRTPGVTAVDVGVLCMLWMWVCCADRTPMCVRDHDLTCAPDTRSPAAWTCRAALEIVQVQLSIRTAFE